jgi:hypothetical protein
MLENNKKAKELIQESKELLAEADSELKEHDDSACEYVAKYAQLREDVLSKSVQLFENTYDKIENCIFPDAEITYTEKELEDIKENFYNKAPKIEPVEIPSISTGSFSSMIVGIIWSAIAFILIIGIGAKLTGTVIDPRAIPATLDQVMKLIDPILNFYGDVLTPNRGTAQNGLILVGAVSAFIGFLFAIMRYHSISSKNLKLAQEIYEKAQAQKIEKDIQRSKIVTLCEHTQRVDEAVHTLHIYLEEYNATLVRILHIEGNNFETYKELSRQKVQTAAILYKELSRLMETEIVAQNGELNPISLYALSLATQRLNEIEDGELEFQEEVPYVEEITEEDATPEDELDDIQDEISQSDSQDLKEGASQEISDEKKEDKNEDIETQEENTQEIKKID